MARQVHIFKYDVVCECTHIIYRISSLSDTILIGFKEDARQISREFFQPNEQWDVVGSESELGIRLSASNARFTVLLRRKPLYFLINVVLPILILSTITLAVFWLPADSGEKVGLSVTIVLAFSVMQLVVADIIPRTSDTVPILGNLIKGTVPLNFSL